MAKQQTIQMAMQTRAAVPVPSSISEEARTIDYTFTTGAAVERWGYVEHLEVSASAIDLSRFQSGRANALDTHNSDTVRAIVGQILDAGVDEAKQEGWCRVKFATGTPAADEAWTLARQGMLQNCSVGYSVERWVEEMRDGVCHRTGVRWTPVELSLCSVPADAGAFARGDKQFISIIEKKERKMRKIATRADAAAEVQTVVDDAKTEIDAIIEQTDDPAIVEKLDEAKATLDEIVNDVAEKEGGDGEPATGEEGTRDGEGEEAGKEEEQRKAKRSAEILDMCTLAGCSALETRKFINSTNSAAEVRKSLLANQSNKFRNNPTSAIQRPNSGQKRRSLADVAKDQFGKK